MQSTAQNTVLRLENHCKDHPFTVMVLILNSSEKCHTHIRFTSEAKASNYMCLQQMQRGRSESDLETVPVCVCFKFWMIAILQMKPKIFRCLKSTYILFQFVVVNKLNDGHLNSLTCTSLLLLYSMATSVAITYLNFHYHSPELK